MFLQDIRDYQILFLSLFLILGIGTRDWTLRPDLMLVAIATCLITQCLAVSILPKLKSKLLCLFIGEDDRDEINNLAERSLSIRSAIITSLGICLLLRADNYTTMILAGCLAILSKFIFKVGRKHFFNPANFGIISVLVLTPDAWVSPGQWGDDWWYALVFAGTGGMVLKRVGRWDTTAAFLGSYALLEAVRNIWLGWTWDVFSHRLMSGSLLLFSLFMITDPRSIPNARVSRLMWAAFIAALTFILRNYFFVSTAVFWALFITAPLSVIFDLIWSAPQFSWFVKADYVVALQGEPAPTTATNNISECNIQLT